jgi:hypothetical protein
VKETRLWWRRGRRKSAKGIEGGRQCGALIKMVRMCKWYDDYQPSVAKEGAGPVAFEWRTICFSSFKLQSNFVSCISPSTAIEIWWYLFLNLSINQYLFIYDFFSYVIPFLGCCLYSLYWSL